MIRILTVCTGNICRSRLAAQLLVARLASARFHVDSVGTSPMLGERLLNETTELIYRMDLPPLPGHMARALTLDDVVASDLILGMDRQHRKVVASMYPPAVRRAYTLLEFAHVVSQFDAMSPLWQNQEAPKTETDVLGWVTRMRGVVPRLSPDAQYDAEDPYGRSKQAFERSAEELERAVNQIGHFFQWSLATVPTTALERLPQS